MRGPRRLRSSDTRRVHNTGRGPCRGRFITGRAGFSAGSFSNRRGNQSHAVRETQRNCSGGHDRRGPCYRRRWLAQPPSPTPAPAVPSGSATGFTQNSSDPDRLRAVEQKLDRILEALGGSRRGTSSSSSRSSSGSPDLAPEESVSTTRFTPQPGYSSTPAASSAPTAETVTHVESTDRLLTMERRLADVERRLHELERRLNATHAPSALPSTNPGQPAAGAALRLPLPLPSQRPLPLPS